MDQNEGGPVKDQRKLGLKDTVGPLRRIVEIVRPALDVFGSARVRFECGHDGSVSSGAIYKGRCRKCRSGSTPSRSTTHRCGAGKTNQARSSPQSLDRPEPPNLSESDHVVDGSTFRWGRSR